MCSWRKVTAIGLAICLAHISLADLAMSVEPATASNPTVTRQQVDHFGVGANVKIQLTDGRKLRGPITALSFWLPSRQSEQGTSRPHAGTDD